MREPGALRHRLVLERPERVPDGCGGTQVTFVHAATVWAALDVGAVLRPLIADQVDERLQHRILIRFRDDVATGWQALFGDRELEIVSLRDPDERGAWLELTAREQGR